MVAVVAAETRLKRESEPETVTKPEEKVADSPKKPDLSAHKPDNKAVIKKKVIKTDTEGNFQVQYETSNGISSNEAGVGGQIVQGSTTWIAKNGEVNYN